MAPERPASVLVIGILNIVFGGWGVVTYIATGLSIAMMMVMSKTPASAVNPLGGMIDFMEKEVPGYMAIMIGSSVGAMTLMILLIVSGIGLIKMRQWGRWLAMSIATFNMLWQLVGVVLALLLFTPALMKWNKHALEEMQKQNPGMASQMQMQMDLQNNPTLNNLSPILVALFVSSYALVILIVLLRPSVARAFAEHAAFIRQQGSEPGPDSGGEVAIQA
jgi:hypothetical protein